MKLRTWGVSILTSLLSTVVLARPAAAQLLGAKPAAVTNGEAISAAELDKQVQYILKQRPPANALSDAQKKQMCFDVLTSMIDDLLMRQFLRKNAPRIEQAEVNRELAQLEVSLKAQKQSLKDFCRDNGQTEAELRDDIVSRCQWRGYAQARISEAEVHRYYDEYMDFFDKVQVRVSHIVLRVPANSSEAQIQATRDKLLALRQEIVAGKIDFAEAAKKYSQCPSAPKGGDIDYVYRKGHVHEGFAKAAFALKVGEISDVVQTDYGLHLIKATDRKPGQPSDYNKIKDDVRMFYESELWQVILAQERVKSKVDINLP